MVYCSILVTLFLETTIYGEHSISGGRGGGDCKRDTFLGFRFGFERPKV